MRRSTLRLPIALVLGIAVTQTVAWALSDARNAPSWPFDPGFPRPAFRPSIAPSGPAGRSNPGVTTPLVEPPKADAKPRPATEADQLNELFARLAKAGDANEAGSIAALIQRAWLRSGSDTADLIMDRAMAALGHGNSPVATALLDHLVTLDPTWAEAWNKRATLRFLADDDDGAMQDIAHVLAIEPRHFGALSGMSFILARHGMKKDALGLLRRTDAIYPHNPELEKMIDQLGLEVEGRDI